MSNSKFIENGLEQLAKKVKLEEQNAAKQAEELAKERIEALKTPP